jgi:hypothetical protein
LLFKPLIKAKAVPPVGGNIFIFSNQTVIKIEGRKGERELVGCLLPIHKTDLP